MGIVGMETAFCTLHTGLVQKGILPLERLLWLMTYGPAKVLGVPCGIQPGNQADLVLLDLAAQYTIDSNQFYSMGKSTPFDGWHVTGKVVRTIYRGQTVYVEE